NGDCPGSVLYSRTIAKFYTWTMQTAVGVFGSEGADAGWKSNCPPIMESEEDDMWYPEAREPYEDIEARGIEFLKWLWTRPEKEIAIVSHGVVLQHFLYVLENDSADPSVKTGLCRRFNNCELRSVVVVNKGMMDSDCVPSATN
ncbi:hypothetical protein CUMW_109240, partial [Citrus unshiu]